MARLIGVLCGLIILVGAVSGCSDPRADAYKRGNDAYKRGDYARALAEWQPLAERGDAAAQYGLGLLYRDGRGVPEGESQSAIWFGKAADQGHAEAQYELGALYEEGRGVPEDDAKAAALFREAADRGYGWGQLGMGYLHEHGRGVAKDLVEAFLWYDRGMATLTAGTLTREEREAVLGNRDRAFTTMTDAERETAVARRASELLPRANDGNAEAQFNLGWLYEPGDRAAAAAWYRKAADQGHAEAQFSLGILHGLGEGVSQDDAEAAAWYRKAAEQEHARAQLALGLLYERGDGVPQDYAQAAAWYRKAVDQRDSDAQDMLDSLYARGLVAK